MFCFAREQAAGKLVADIKVDDSDTELLTGKQVLQPVDELSDTVLLPSPGMSVVLDLLGNRNISPTRYVALFRLDLLLFRYSHGWCRYNNNCRYYYLKIAVADILFLIAVTDMHDMLGLSL